MFKTDLFKGKKFLVTGGGTGLGRSMTEKFVELGAEVVIIGRRKEMLDKAAAEITAKHGGKVTPIPCDIRVAQAIEDMVEEVWQAGPLDGLINNAAGNFISQTKDLSPRAFDAIAGIVLHGTFYVTSACGRRWLAEGRRASVLSILTTWVWTGSPFTVPSAMSKAGVAAMTQSLAVEWGPRGIRCNAIAPGPFPTEGAWERLRIGGRKAESKDDYATNPMRRAGEQDELGNFAAFLMADECAYINGEVIAIDGGAWLNNAGNYARLWNLGDEDWKRMRDQVQSQNVKDKSERTV